MDIENTRTKQRNPLAHKDAKFIIGRVTSEPAKAHAPTVENDLSWWLRPFIHVVQHTPDAAEADRQHCQQIRQFHSQVPRVRPPGASTKLCDAPLGFNRNPGMWVGPLESGSFLREFSGVIRRPSLAQRCSQVF